MNKEKFIVFDGIEVPSSPVLAPIRDKGYGSIKGLSDEELISPDELERMIYTDEFAEILSLPAPKKTSVVKHVIDDSGKPDWGAFGTVDFDRFTGGLDKARYKADRLKEELFNQRLKIEIISGRIKTTVKYKVIKYVFAGILDVDDIADMEMFCLAKACLRARRIQREIAELKERSRQRRQKQTEKVLGSLS